MIKTLFIFSFLPCIFRILGSTKRHIMENYNTLLDRQKQFFNLGYSKDIKFRKQSLKKLKKTILEMKGDIAESLAKDLNKPSAESYLTEIGVLLTSINYCLRHIGSWAKKQRKSSILALFPSRSYVIPEPYGSVLIIAPWNYPVLLALDPLISAIAAGNCAVIKPSEMAPAASAVICKIIRKCFDEEYVCAIEGGAEETERLTSMKFDYIFFTGSPEKGKLVMQKAAENLIPVTLELGGKSPCIIDESADINMAMKRIIFGKILNAGQTCVAPDYLLVHSSHKEKLKEAFETEVKAMLGDNPLDDKTYPRIVNSRHFERITNYLNEGHVLSGGTFRTDTLQISPTLLEITNTDVPVMRDEIFGPVLPLIYFDDFDETINALQQKEKPLALYLFTFDKKHEDSVLEKISFGGGCINDCIMHLVSPHLPFGGVGKSGIGCYHGKYGFDTFSHKKSIVSKATYPDINVRYRPYTKFKMFLVKMLLK